MSQTKSRQCAIQKKYYENKGRETSRLYYENHKEEKRPPIRKTKIEARRS